MIKVEFRGSGARSGLGRDLVDQARSLRVQGWGLKHSEVGTEPGQRG